MQLVSPSSEHIVANVAQAAAFQNQLRCHVLIACAHTEKTLSQLQAELDAPLAKLHYHVERLIGVGLLVVARSEARAGRAIRHFRAVSDHFWVPQAYLDQLPGDIWATELRQALRDEHNRVGEMALIYGPDPQGKMAVRLVRTGDTVPPRAIELWRRLRLDSAQRVAFAKELAALFERYAHLESGDSAKEYLAHAAFAPQA